MRDLRVLVVDDFEGMRDSIRDFVSGLGYAVWTASSGEEALRIAVENNMPFDLLVTDIEMPRMDGVELWHRFKAVVPAAQVLFLSGHSEEMFKDNELLPGKVLSKPLDLPKFQEALHAMQEKIGD